MLKKRTEFSVDAETKRLPFFRIISGGQTGVDRGALEAAIAFGLEHGGWCPAGRLSEDGTIPSRYHLAELESSEYAARTERNVLDADATLILYGKRLTSGTRLTALIAKRLKRPLLAIRIDHRKAVSEICHWLRQIQPSTLNVAGPRGSTHPEIESQCCDLLLKVFECVFSDSNET